MRRLLVLPALLVAACGSGSSKDSASTVIPPGPQQSVPSCGTVLVDGAPVTKAIIEAGCKEPVDGSIVTIPAFVCIGGSQLASPDYSGGHFWGLTGGTWHKVTNNATDPAYSAAYTKCNA